MSKATDLLNQLESYINEEDASIMTALKDLVWLIEVENARLANFGEMGAARDAIKGVKGYDPLTELKRLVKLVEVEDDLLTTFKEFEKAQKIVHER